MHAARRVDGCLAVLGDGDDGAGLHHVGVVGGSEGRHVGEAGALAGVGDGVGAGLHLAGFQDGGRSRSCLSNVCFFM